MSINEMVEKFTERKGETKENLRLILEAKQQLVDLQTAHGETPRITTEKHFQRIANNEIGCAYEDVRTQIRMLARAHEQYGLSYEWPFDWR